MNNTLAKLFITTVGRSSDGIRLCLTHGLTSGKMVDYIYQNEPTGKGMIGKTIDRLFLNHCAWEAVRVRRDHLERLIGEAIEELREKREGISLVDIASGPAGYIISVLRRKGEHDVVARCRDYDERWLVEGANQAKANDLKHVFFEKGDAFNDKELRSLIPKPNIIVSSGFYDWINEDAKVKDSIAMIFDCLKPGGYFISTIQTRHPNLKLVETVFRDFNQEPLKMKMRSERQFQQWLRDAGFSIRETLSDNNGYYSVVKAVKSHPASLRANGVSEAI